MKKLNLSKAKVLVGVTILILVGTLQAQTDTNKVHVKNGMHHSDEMIHSDHGNVVWKSPIDLSAIDKNGDGMVFQDQMDWNVISDEAGVCRLCGMTLKEVSLDEAKANLLSNGFTVISSNHKNNSGKTDSETALNQSTASKSYDAVIWNKYCPVTGKKISKSAETLKYEGKIIGFCCAGSKHHEVFLKDPERYLKNLSSDGQEFIGEK